MAQPDGRKTAALSALLCDNANVLSQQTRYVNQQVQGTAHGQKPRPIEKRPKLKTMPTTRFAPQTEVKNLR